MNQTKIGHGVFMWMSPERTENRYGAFFMSDETFAGNKVANALLNARAFRPGRYRVTAKVVAARLSGHAGDHALRIFPTIPDVGEEIDLGVADVSLAPSDCDPDITTIVMMPGDGREELWMDPRKMYRLHDQTVDIYVEQTTDDYTTAPNLPPPEKGIFANGDGSIQVKKTRVPRQLPPQVTRFDDDTFLMDWDYCKGQRIGD